MRRKYDECFSSLVMAMVALLAVMAVGCAKKPTTEECEQAWRHVRDVSAASVAEQFQAGQKLGDIEITPEMARLMKEGAAKLGADYDKKPPSEAYANIKARIDAALIEACRSRPLARARCILEARTIDDLIQVCKMKASPGPRGGVSLSWPD